MDVITHGLAGALMAQSVARPKEARFASVIGFIAGLLADADILIRSADDPLLTLEYHRQFTHALLFVPIGGLVAALLLWPFLRRHFRAGRLYLLGMLGYLPSGLLDACTSYGTQLLWPVSDTRVSWNAIAVIDPLFTAVLAGAFAFALFRRVPPAARIGLSVAVLYLLVGVAQRERAEVVALNLAKERGHTVERLEAKPTMGNLILWRTVYEAGGRYYADGVRIGVGAARVYPGNSVERFVPAQVPGLAADSVLARDIARFAQYSDGFVARHPGDPQMIGDARYSMLPTGVTPLWGIEVDAAHADRHAPFHTSRPFDATTRQAFVAMLRGQSL